MDRTIRESHNQSYLESGDVLLDLDNGGPAVVASSEDFVLDLDLDEGYDPMLLPLPFQLPALNLSYKLLKVAGKANMDSGQSQLLLSQNPLPGVEILLNPAHHPRMLN